MLDACETCVAADEFAKTMSFKIDQTNNIPLGLDEINVNQISVAFIGWWDWKPLSSLTFTAAARLKSQSTLRFQP